MRLMRVGRSGEEKPAVQNELGETFDLATITLDIDGAFLASDGVKRAREALDRGELPLLPASECVRVGPPVARPHAIWCIGMNYAEHAAESGAPSPSRPVLFLKAPNTLVGPNDNICLPRGSNKTDWEVELAVVIGRQASYLATPDEAPAYVAGYSITNDVSERAYQLEESGGQWSKGKCCATFNPLGPWLVPADEIDVGSLRLRSWVNDEPRQDATTADMIFAVDFLIWHLSQFAILEPGDIVNTGTPRGVALSGRFPYLRKGDIVTTEIEGLGRQQQYVLDDH